MVKMKIKTPQGEGKTVLVPEQKSIREILEEHADGMPHDTVIMNGKKLTPDELDKSIPELGLSSEEEIELFVLEELPFKDEGDEESMPGAASYTPKAILIGCACIIQSAFTPDELKDFTKYMPEALTKYDKNEEPAFVIGLDEASPGSLNKYGAVFSGKTNREGKATITILIDPECEDTGSAVRETIGAGILSLIEMEGKLTELMDEMEEKKALLEGHIIEL